MSRVIKKWNFPEIPFHNLRHTHATTLLQLGENPKVVSERLGHSNISITLDTYSHVLPNMQKSLADHFDLAIIRYPTFALVYKRAPKWHHFTILTKTKSQNPL
jgi:integrase